MNNNKPYLNVSAVRKYKDENGVERSQWTRIGAAFPNSKGGFSLKLDLMPVDRELDIVAMPPQENDRE